MHSRRLPCLLLPLVLACASACAPLPNPRIDLPPPATMPRVTAQATLHEHLVGFETDKATLRPDEAVRLERFLASLPPEARIQVIVAGHADERASNAYNLDLSARRSAAVAKHIAGAGFVNVSVGERAFGEELPRVAGTGPQVWASNRRVEVQAVVWEAKAPGCPRWPAPLGHDPYNQPMPQLGCATANNLAQMIADPGDLVVARPLAPADGARAVLPVRAYRDGEPTASLDAVEGLE